MDINTPVPTIYGNHFEKFSETWKTQISELKSKFGEAIEEVRFPREFPTDVPIVYVKKESIIAVLETLRATPGMEYGFLADLTATDEEISPRFEVVYQLLSHTNMARIRVKVRLNDGEEIPTVTTLWMAANWPEREVWDMFGIKFTNHPHMRRILMDDRWVGHPLRKDYPLRGYQIFPDSPPPKPEYLEKGDR
jgi:NADH-quinone oxidoreductase subunit C